MFMIRGQCQINSNSEIASSSEKPILTLRLYYNFTAGTFTHL